MVVSFDRTVIENDAWSRASATNDTLVIDGGASTPYERNLRVVLPDPSFDGIDWGDKYIYDYSPYANVLQSDAWSVYPSAASVSIAPDWGFEALTPEIATIDAIGEIRRVEDAVGHAWFRITSGPLEIVDEFSIPFGLSAPPLPDSERLDSYKPASLGYAMDDALRGKIAGESAGVETQSVYTTVPSNSDYVDWRCPKTNRLYSKNVGGIDEFVRNTSGQFLGHGLDLTAVSPGWRKRNETLIRRRKTATLIAPRFFISCNHASYYPPIGASVIFVDNANQLHEAEVVDTKHMGGDIQIGLLDRDIPAAITPVRFFSPDALLNKTTHWHTGMGTDVSRRLTKCTALGFTQHELLVPYEPSKMIPIFVPYLGVVWDYFKGTYKDWHVDIYPGDSGNPVLHFLDGLPVHLSQYMYPMNGPTMHYYPHYIQATMDELAAQHGAPTQTITHPDVSGYPDYEQI